MKIGQFLLLKLMEECTEVGQRCSKQIQFGKLEAQVNQPLTNAERLKQELLDLFSVVRLLQERNEVPEISDSEIEQAIVNKKAKLQKYLQMSYSLGELPEITL